MSTTGTSEPRTTDYLRNVEFLAPLKEEDLERLVSLSRTVDLPAGTWLIREGETGEEMFLILAGQLEVSVREGHVEEVVAWRGRGEVVGEMALLGSGLRTASVRAVTAAQVLSVGREALAALLSCSADAATTIYRTSLEREHAHANLLARREKLAALGAMAAGLAHELNNPAASLKRSAAEIPEAMRARERAAIRLFTLGLQGDELAAARELDAAMPESPATMAGSGGARGASNEEALTDLLTDLGVPEPWNGAAALADMGWTGADLTRVLGSFAPGHRAAAADWLTADAGCHSLQRDITISSDAISALVGAVKDYTHLDRAPVALVDVHASLETTLVILKHRLKHGGVRLVREYAPDLPRIEGYVSELNQVWTNLIDNAVAAMNGSGTLTLRTSSGDGQVSVEVVDDGPGIPPDVATRLFEPFMTTKGVGEGTGLGLYLSKEIVEKRHGGSLTFTSASGATAFRVTLPSRLPPTTRAASPR